MEYTPELTRSLNELKRITGLSLDVHADTMEEMTQAADQIHLLCNAYKNKYDREYFFQELIHGRTSSNEVRDLAARFHIDAENPRVLFLLEAASPLEDFVTEILKNLFPSRNNTVLIPIDSFRIAVLQSLKKKDTEVTIQKTAYTMSDTLSMEALISVKISYSRIFDRLQDVPAAFQDVSTVLKIGKIFNSEQNIFPYNQLGIGQLIYQLPVSLCENFLTEIFGEKIPRTLDDDLLHAVNAFFKNNLNIAETARQLHMHRNTLIYRLEQIQKNTGLDLRRFEDAIVFRIASMVISYLQTKKEELI